MKIKKFLFKQLSVISNFALLLILCSTIAQAAGEIDASFNAYLGKVGAGTVYRTVVQPDGKIIATGNFNMVNGVLKYTIFRLNTDGTLDTTFNSPSIVGLEQIVIHAIGLQSDGKIVIAGPFQSLNGVVRQGIARLNSDGSLDTAFNSNPSLNVIQGFDLKIAPDDKIIFSGFRSDGARIVRRINVDGSLDAETTRDAFRLDIQPDGKIVYFGNTDAVRRLNQDLTLDNTFTQVIPNNTVYLVKALPDGKTLISGIFTQINGTSSPGLVRINANGSVDASFASNMSGVGSVAAVIYLPNGKIIVPASGGTLALRNPDGTLDPSFTASTNINGGITDLDLLPDGKIVVSGSANPDSVARTLVVRLNADGSPDTSFQTAIGSFAYGNRVKTLPDNKFFVAGSFNYASGAARHELARFNADGTIDTSFNQNVFFNNTPIFDVFPDGKIVAYSAVALAKLNSDGSPDVAFAGVNPGIRDVKALPDGKVLAAKNGSLERYNSNLTLDGTFNVPVGGDIFDIALQADGKILIGGNFLNVHGIARSKIARLNADGTLDSSFDSPAGSINGVVVNIVLSPGGKIVISGSFSGISFNTREGLARLNADGSLDLGFVPPTSYSLDDVKVQTDGKVLLSGPSSTRPIWRLNANGSLDTAFHVTATVGNSDTPRIRGLDLQSDGKIIITGDFLRINGVLAPGIARLRNTSKASFDYDGDGRADISVFRPSENKWYVLRSSDGVVTQQVFAISNDVPVPSDFDGDGKTDFAIFRPSSGDWWYLSSVNGSQSFAHWGASGDIARPSDFDGDGRSDFVLFRPSDSFWYRISSSNGASSNKGFGLAGDKPVIGDFDGDGKSDVAIFRPSTGDWWWQSSVDNVQRATHWGISTDIPAPADYDGDGKTDFAVYRPSSGTWYIYNSATLTSTALNFGISEDKPVAADYDGDGKSDIAVFRPSTGVWYLMKSTEGFTAIQFGVATDIPTPNAFVP